MKDKKILIVDDEPYITKVLEFILKKGLYEVHIARDGSTGLRMIRELHPDMVFLDIMMPEKDGFEICREIRMDPGFNDTYIILLTAKGQDIDREKGLSVGANEYLTKPFSPSRILEKVNSILG